MADVINFPKQLGAGTDRDGLPNYGPGDRGPGVAQLQQRLNQWGFNVGRSGADGLYGNETAAAVKALQSKLGILADGIWGAGTRTAVTADLKSQNSVIRATQAAMGLQPSFTDSVFPTQPASSTTSGAVPGSSTTALAPQDSAVVRALKSPIIWIGAAAIVGGAVLLMRNRRRSAVANYDPDYDPLAGIGEAPRRRGRGKLSADRWLPADPESPGREPPFGRHRLSPEVPAVVRSNREKFTGCAKSCKGKGKDFKSCVAECMR